MDRDLDKDYGDMVNKLARKFYFANPRFDLDDLRAEGRMAVVKAVQNRPQDTPYKESTWVYNAISMEMMSFVRRNKFDVHVSEYEQKECWRDKDEAAKLNSGAMAVRLDAQHAVDVDGYSKDAYDIIASGEPPALEKLIDEESRSILMEEINRLPEREKNVLMEFYGGQTLREIADNETQRNGRKCSPQRAAEIKNRAFTKVQTSVKRRYADAIS
jgi:RNA polymerase sigma factor (sigma-70 family)